MYIIIPVVQERVTKCFLLLSYHSRFFTVKIFMLDPPGLYVLDHTELYVLDPPGLYVLDHTELYLLDPPGLYVLDHPRLQQSWEANDHIYFQRRNDCQKYINILKARKLTATSQDHFIITALDILSSIHAESTKVMFC